MYKVSVIVPVYNASKYLAKCLDSILGQTLKEIEVILVNDCSPDEKDELICKEYASKDSRIVYLKNEVNIGLGLTRNAGLEIARGDYISFIDSDDWLDLDCLSICCDYLFTDNLDVICFGVRYVKSNYKIGDIYSTKIDKPIVVDNTFVLDYYMENMNKFLMMIACNKIYKRSFLQLHKLEFHDLFYEDNDFSFRVHYYAKKYMLIPNVFYNYYQHLGSISGSLTHKHANDIVNSLLYIKDFLIATNEWDKHARSFYHTFVKGYLYGFSNRIICMDNGDLEQKISIKNLWITRLMEHSLINEMLIYLSPHELWQMFSASSIASQRDALIKQRDDYQIYAENRYKKLYYSEWANFGRLSMLGKIFYLMKKIIRFPVKLLLKFIKNRGL